MCPTPTRKCIIFKSIFLFVHFSFGLVSNFFTDHYKQINDISTRVEHHFSSSPKYQKREFPWYFRWDICSWKKYSASVTFSNAKIWNYTIDVSDHLNTIRTIDAKFLLVLHVGTLRPVTTSFFLFVCLFVCLFAFLV